MAASVGPYADALWVEIRRHYEFDPDRPSLSASAERAASRLGTSAPSRAAAHKRQRQEGWERQAPLSSIVESAHRLADRMVQSDGSAEDQPAIPAEPDPAAPAVVETDKEAAQSDLEYMNQARTEAEDKRAELLARHRKEWKQVAVLRQESVALRIHNAAQALDRARLAKITAETTKLQQDGERRAWGIDDTPTLPDLSKLTDDELRAVLAGKVPSAIGASKAH